MAFNFGNLKVSVSEPVKSTGGFNFGSLNDRLQAVQEERARQEQERLAEQKKVVEAANEAIKTQQDYRQRVADRSEGGFFNKIRAFGSSVKSFLGKNEKDVLPEIPNAPVQYNAIRQAQEAKKNYNSMWAGRAGNAIAGAANTVKQKASDYAGVAETILKGATPGYEPTPEEAQESLKALKGVGSGAVKATGELASGAAKFGMKYGPGLMKYTNPLGIASSSLDMFSNNDPRIKDTVNSFLENNRVLNYKPEYANEYEKTGGEIAEVGSWFIPLTRLGKVEKLERAIIELPKVAKFLGTKPQIVKSGGKLFYEVTKDAVDTVLLEKLRGKGWDEVSEEAGMAAAGGTVIRGIFKVFGLLGKKAPRLEKMVEEGTTTEKEIMDLFDEGGIKAVEDKISEPRLLKQGELAQETKAVEEITGNLEIKDKVEVKNKLEKGFTPEEIADDIVNPKVELSAIEKANLSIQEIAEKSKQEEITDYFKVLKKETKKAEELEILEKVKNKLLETKTGKSLTKKQKRITEIEQKIYNNSFKTDPDSFEPGLEVGDRLKDIRKALGSENKILDIEDYKSTIDKMKSPKRKEALARATYIGGNNKFDYNEDDVIDKLKEFVSGKNKAKKEITELNKELKEIKSTKRKDEIAFNRKLRENFRVEKVVNKMRKISKKTPKEVRKGADKKKPVVKKEATKTPSKIAKSIETKAVEKKSKLASRMNEDLPDDYKLDEFYDSTTIKKELNQASSDIAKNKDKAMIEAFSKDTKATQRVAKLTELAEIAKRNGDFEAQNAILSRMRREGTEAGQEINMFKAYNFMNPETEFMKHVVNSRLKKLSVGISDVTKAKKAAMAKLTEVANDIRKKTKNFKVKDAQDLFNKLICK